jgi:hypothetical protein
VCRGQPVHRRLTAAHIPTPDFSALETASARAAEVRARGARTRSAALDASAARTTLSAPRGVRPARWEITTLRRGFRRRSLIVARMGNGLRSFVRPA